MQQHIYSAKGNRIFRQSFFIWFSVAMHIAANIIAIPTLINKSQVWGILLVNIVFGFLSIPSVILFFNYFKHSFNKKFIITYDSLKLVDERTGAETELRNSEVKKIYLIENIPTSKLPWSFHEYIIFVDDKQNKIIVTSYFMDISDFWLDTLTRKVSSNKLIRQEKIYPIIS